MNKRSERNGLPCFITNADGRMELEKSPSCAEETVMGIKICILASKTLSPRHSLTTKDRVSLCGRGTDRHHLHQPIKANTQPPKWDELMPCVSCSDAQRRAASWMWMSPPPTSRS